MLSRAATQMDLMTVATWITSAQDCEYWAGNALPYPLQLDRLSEQINLLRENSFCLVDGHIVAFGQVIDKGQSDNVRRAHLAKIIVAPNMRARGVGNKLIAELIAIARTKSFDVLGLHVHPDNHIAIKLYTQLGFEFGEPPATLPAISNSSYMSLSLS